VNQGLWVAHQADAEFHLLHVVDSMKVPDDALAKTPQSQTTRNTFNDGVEKHLDAFLKSVPYDRDRIHVHRSRGALWQEVRRAADQVRADLIALGTLGRRGNRGLLGKTAEKALGTCKCSILTVKPADFVSPIETAFWPLHPPAEEGS
jgi:nucleotide-binding universal stress UspA family protein